MKCASKIRFDYELHSLFARILASLFALCLARFLDFHVAVYLQGILLQHTSRATAFTIQQTQLWNLLR